MQDSYDICRSCLSSDCGLLSLESLIDGSLTVKDCLKAHLNVNIIDDDGLPQKICLNCFDSLLHVRKFHLQYLQSEEFLLEQYLESCRKADILEGVKRHDLISDEHNPDNQNLLEEESSTSSNENSKDDRNTFNAHNATDEPGCSSEESSINTLSERLFAPSCLNQDDGLNFLGKAIQTKKGVILEFEQMEDTNLELEVINGASIENTANNKGNINDGKAQSIKNGVKVNNNQRKCTSKFVSCLQCYQKFQNRNELRNHFHSVHEEDNSRGYCTQCSKILPNRGALMTHLYEHSLMKSRLTCSYCEKTFSDREKVISHERTHTGEKPFVCKICGRAFRQSSVLGTHMSLHTGKTVECPRCDKKFSRKSILKVHLRTHDDLRPYECHLCDKKYRMKCHLTSHIATHSNVRNFICEICGKGCKTKDFLRSHMTVHTRPYKCPKCPLEASTTHNLRIHLVKMHRIYDDPKLYKKPTPLNQLIKKNLAH